MNSTGRMSLHVSAGWRRAAAFRASHLRRIRNTLPSNIPPGFLTLQLTLSVQTSTIRIGRMAEKLKQHVDEHKGERARGKARSQDTTRKGSKRHAARVS